jgi:hypothetical protein
VPAGATTERVDNRVRVTWENVESSSILVQYYKQNDLTIFGAIIGILSAIAVGGLYYYRRQIDRLHETRVEMGLDDEDNE